MPGVEKNGGVPLLFGGQRWKCVNSLCGDVPENVAVDIPRCVMVPDGRGGDRAVCEKCWERAMMAFASLAPMLAPFDPESLLPHDEQLRQKRNAQEEADEARFQEQMANMAGKEAEKQPESQLSNEERAEAAGLVLA